MAIITKLRAGKALARLACTSALVAGMALGGIDSASAQSLLEPTGTPILLDDVSAQAAVNELMTPVQGYMAAAGSGNTTNIAQVGAGNYATSAIVGTGSLSLIAQSGTNNRAVQAIEGSNSAALLVQGGSNNNVIQASRGNNNFQMVGVSGSNNDVAYIQTGDNLAGALDVRGSTNSTVLAIQTPASGNYMMPTGINGLRDKVVVVVPGRMYVLNK